MTQSIYLKNVQWYLQLLLQGPCTHVIWLQNTAPLLNWTDPVTPPPYAQTVQSVRSYDQAVYESLMLAPATTPAVADPSSTLMSESVSTMDVWEASLKWSHADNIHLTSDWNRELGMFFVKLATKVSGTWKQWRFTFSYYDMYKWIKSIIRAVSRLTRPIRRLLRSPWNHFFVRAALEYCTIRTYQSERGIFRISTLRFQMNGW